jgi:hypothetical protein
MSERKKKPAAGLARVQLATSSKPIGEKVRERSQ